MKFKSAAKYREEWTLGDLVWGRGNKKQYHSLIPEAHIKSRAGGGKKREIISF